jgi:AcrR family transcriptional regulator
MSAPGPAKRSGSMGGYAPGRLRRAEIIRIASTHFAARGFESATILEIAAECGISRAGLLHYFPDKEALLHAVLEDRDNEDRLRFRPYANVPGGIGILRAMVELAEHNRLVPGLIDLFVRLSAEASTASHPAHEYFVERYERIRRGTEGALAAAAAAGFLRPEISPADASVRLTALMDGLQAQWLMDDRVDMAHHIRTAIEELLTSTGQKTFAEISAE